jgi:RIO-like serine/threonine protein kinase
MDFINGENLNFYNCKLCEVKDEIDFTRMALLLLRELNIFHKQYFHCDISPSNIIAFKDDKGTKNFFFMLIDYGSSFKTTEKKLPHSFTEKFSPPHEKNSHW